MNMDKKPTTPARILIVDDHPNTAAMLARVLSKFDTPVDVMTASSGEDALQKIGDSLVDVLITDFMMPGMNGLELIEKFKGGREPAHTILITAYDTPGLALTARRLKVQDYLVKPVQPDKIREIVAGVLSEIQPAQDKPTTADPHKPAKVLIADDYPDNIRLLAARLRSEGYSSISAEDGEETLEQLRLEKPDILLLDVNMPKKDGFEVLAEMRADPEISHIPVLIITAARIGPQDIREGLTLGADDYITKPFDWRELAARIRTKLRVKQAEDELRRRNQELGVLPEIGQDIASRLEIEELTTMILKRTVEALGANDAQLVLFNSDNSVFQRSHEENETIILAGAEAQHFKDTHELIPHVSSTQQGVIITDVANDNRWNGNQDNGVRSAISVPLLGSHEVLGALTLTQDRIAFFNEDHLAILQAIASQAAIAVENAQLLNVERRRVQELVALNQLTRDISLFTQSDDLFENLPNMIQQAMGYPTVAMWLMVDEKLTMRSIAGGEKTVHESLLEIAPQQAAGSGQPAQASGSVDESKSEESDPDSPNVHSAIAVPLFWHSKINGVLSIHSMKLGAFHDSDRVVLETLASQIASAYERILLFESIEQQRRRLAAVLDGAPDAILVIDEDRTLQMVNPAGERLFTDIEAQVGNPLPANQGYDELILALNSETKNDGNNKGEITWPDGRIFSSSLTPIEEGGQIVILHDVSHFKALDEIKNEFIATATHDLKNPIFAVMGYSDLLKKAGSLNETQDDFVIRIRNAAMQMQDLVLNLLEIARMEMSPELNLVNLDLNGLLTYVAGDFQKQAETRNHTLSTELPETTIYVKGDKMRLEQVVRNLISNAIKYTPDGGEIVVSTETNGNKVTVKVEDNGFGIPSESLPYIFEQFYRVQTPETQEIEGNGLGLAIVKTIVERHGGEMSVDSTLGEGSCFSFELKQAPE
jgi:signal transduction histidine kinase/DNA-binding response OmpR family regulator